MPTKQQYLAQYRELFNSDTKLQASEQEKYEEIIRQIPNGKSPMQWLKEQKQDLKKQKDEFTGSEEYMTAYDEAAEKASEKYDKIKAKVEANLQEANDQIDLNRLKIHDEETFKQWTDARDYYNMSLNNLRFYSYGTSRSFPDSPTGLKGWSIDMEDHKPYKPFAEKMKAFEEREEQLETYGHLILRADTSLEKEMIQHGLAEKKAAFNSLNGWQKFWARVLPSAWYSKAKDYADMKAQESAMREFGIPTNEDERVNAPVDAHVEPVGESLPEDVVKDLQQKTELQPAKENGKSFEDMQSGIDLNESMRMNKNI